MPGPSHPPRTLKLERISRSFGSVLAVDGVDLIVPPGSLTALLGPSGSGKTTTLRIIAGFDAPSGGRVLVDDVDIVSLPPNRRNLGMVFQDYSLFPHMTVEANVGFSLKVAGVDRAETGRRVAAMLAMVQLPAHGNRYPSQLSGGQQQRVALARALINNPSLLLLDEPLGALDRSLRETMQFELRRIQQELGITTVMVTHDQEEAMTLSDNIAVMNEGKIYQVGKPSEVYEFPNSRFVAEFLGTANLIGGKVVGHRDDCAVVSCDNKNTQDQILVEGRYAAGTPVMVGIRPEKLTISTVRPDRANVLEGRVKGRVFRGTYHVYQIEYGGVEESIYVYEQSVSRFGEDMPDIGRHCFFGWNPKQAFVFENGENAG